MREAKRHRVTKWKKRLSNRRNGSKPISIDNRNEGTVTFRVTGTSPYPWQPPVDDDYRLNYAYLNGLVVNKSPSRQSTRYEWLRFPEKKPVIWQRPNFYFSSYMEMSPFNGKLVDIKPKPDFPDGSVAQPSRQFISSFFDNTYPVYTTVDFSTINLHYLKFNKKLLDQRVDMLTVLAESKSTIQMIANASQDLFDFYRHVKKGNLKGIRKIFSKRGMKHHVKKGWKNKSVENRWLEYTYGWSPLLGDITKGLEAYANQKAVPFIFKVGTVSKLGQEGFQPFRSHWRDADGTKEAIISTSCYYTVQDEFLRTRAQWNLAENPMLTAWEMVPYSFVLDWFIPIGDFLAQFSATKGLNFITGTTAYYVKYDLTAKDDNYYFSFQTCNARWDSNVRCKGFLMRREVHYSSPIGLPVIDIGMSVRRALNALALISQRRK